jgi:serine/threonine protein kinase
MLCTASYTRPHMIGRIVGHYRILQQIGAGGMAVVYSAEDTRLHRRVSADVMSLEERRTQIETQMRRCGRRRYDGGIPRSLQIFLARSSLIAAWRGAVDVRPEQIEWSAAPRSKRQPCCVRWRTSARRFTH